MAGAQEAREGSGTELLVIRALHLRAEHRWACSPGCCAAVSQYACLARSVQDTSSMHLQQVYRPLHQPITAATSAFRGPGIRSGARLQQLQRAGPGFRVQAAAPPTCCLLWPTATTCPPCWAPSAARRRMRAEPMPPPAPNTTYTAGGAAGVGAGAVVGGEYRQQGGRWQQEEGTTVKCQQEEEWHAG
jgi:hypothetical protein